MKIVRFVFPFLFIRNWHSGVWEFSNARGIIFGLTLLFIFLGIIIAYVLQAPLVYVAE